MTSQWPDNCYASTWKVISNSLDIDFIHGDIFTVVRVRKSSPPPFQNVTGVPVRVQSFQCFANKRNNHTHSFGIINLKYHCYANKISQFIFPTILATDCDSLFHSNTGKLYAVFPSLEIQMDSNKSFKMRFFLYYGVTQHKTDLSVF